jgi:hypothetical protein
MNTKPYMSNTLLAAMSSLQLMPHGWDMPLLAAYLRKDA